MAESKLPQLYCNYESMVIYYVKYSYHTGQSITWSYKIQNMFPDEKKIIIDNNLKEITKKSTIVALDMASNILDMLITPRFKQNNMVTAEHLTLLFFLVFLYEYDNHPIHDITCWCHRLPHLTAVSQLSAASQSHDSAASGIKTL